jgi:hypothetical protein
MQYVEYAVLSGLLVVTILVGLERRFRRWSLELPQELRRKR